MTHAGTQGVVPSAGRRLAGVEGLRAIAACSVLTLHTWRYGTDDPPGRDEFLGDAIATLGLGVTLFFALSGFLLYRPFAAAIARGEPLPNVGRYLRNRGLRILPAYWVILLAATFVLQTTLVRDAEGDLVTGILDPTQLLASALLVQNYDPNMVATGIGPSWSLAVEVVFYVALPLLALAAFRIAARFEDRRRRLVVLLGPPLVLLGVGAFGKLLAGVAVPAPPDLGYGADWHSVIERSFLCQADLFSFGMALAVLHTEVVDGRLRLPRGWRPATLASGAVLFAAAASSLAVEHGQMSYLPQNTAVALAAALLLGAVVMPAAGAQPVLTRTLERRGFVLAGLISYSVFLWNEPMIRWLEEHGLTLEGWGGFAFNLVVMLAVVGALSWLTYRFVELPALRRKRRTAPETPTMEEAQLEAAP